MEPSFTQRTLMKFPLWWWSFCTHIMCPPQYLPPGQTSGRLMAIRKYSNSLSWGFQSCNRSMAHAAVPWPSVRYPVGTEAQGTHTRADTLATTTALSNHRFSCCWPESLSHSASTYETTAGHSFARTKGEMLGPSQILRGRDISPPLNPSYEIFSEVWVIYQGFFTNRLFRGNTEKFPSQCLHW